MTASPASANGCNNLRFNELPGSIARSLSHRMGEGRGEGSVKILVANLGSTSLKWRLFDLADSEERLLHKGGFERVADYPQAIGDCLNQLKEAGHIQSERELAAVG